MAQIIPLYQFEFYILIFGWVLAVLFGLLTFACFKLTPAKAFLKAWFGKGAIIENNDKTNRKEFLAAKIKHTGTLDIKKFGPMIVSQNSCGTEVRSKVPIFNSFSEYAFTVDSDYPAILTELADKGFPVHNWQDYDHLVKLATDEEYVQEHLNSDKFKDKPKERTQEQEKIKTLQELKLEIKPYKTYNMYDLAGKFPYNAQPTYIESMITEEKNIAARKRHFDPQMWMTIGIVILLILIGLAYLYKTMQMGDSSGGNAAASVGKALLQTAGNTTLGNVNI